LIVANRWNIPADLERKVMARDKLCIYCRQDFAKAEKRGQRRSWEHIINDATIVTRENIALCCISCNASKGVRPLSAWLGSSYCQAKGIHMGNVAPVAQAAAIAPADGAGAA
jgi:hypothetical protein